MVRVNLIEPVCLADQHLVAEYNEILMLLGYVRKYPGSREIPDEFCLGEGHVRFFRDKLGYLKKRHEALREEMIKRGFKPGRIVSLEGFDRRLHNDWEPDEKSMDLIKKRLCRKIEMKPGFYRYYREKRKNRILKTMVRSA